MLLRTPSLSLVFWSLVSDQPGDQEREPGKLNPARQPGLQRTRKPQIPQPHREQDLRAAGGELLQPFDGIKSFWDPCRSRSGSVGKASWIKVPQKRCN